MRRDHLISHALAALAAGISTDDLVFFGGTALSRIFLTDARLSEDIDLVALAPRGQMIVSIERAVRRGFARSHGRPTWRPALSATTGSQPATLVVDDSLGIQIQLVTGKGFLWPTEVAEIQQRYSDAPPARLRTLTAAGFAAAKLAAWIERHAPRNLYDLWALSERGLIDDSAVEVFLGNGPFGRPPSDWVFDIVPEGAAWRHVLGHQTLLRVTAAEALDAVRDAWHAAGQADGSAHTRARTVSSTAGRADVDVVDVRAGPGCAAVVQGPHTPIGQPVQARAQQFLATPTLRTPGPTLEAAVPEHIELPRAAADPRRPCAWAAPSAQSGSSLASESVGASGTRTVLSSARLRPGVASCAR